MVSFATERMSDLSEDVFLSIGAENYNGSHYSHLGSFGASLADHINLEVMDALKFYTMRNEKKELCGYAIFLFVNHPHMKETIIAKQEALFVKKEYRGKGLDLLKFSEERLRASKAKGVVSMVSAEKDKTKAFSRMGYNLLERVYIKEL